MIRKNMICILMLILIMLVFPWCAVTFVNETGGMAVLLFMFFIIDPIAAVATGIFAGKNVRASWFQPLLLTVLFILGTWIFFEMGEGDFVVYGIVYLLLGYSIMLIVSFIRKRKPVS